jgi:serine/threonine protein kinase
VKLGESHEASRMSDTPQAADYRETVAQIWADRRQTESQKATALAAAQQRLGLSDEQARVIEREVIGPGRGASFIDPVAKSVSAPSPLTFSGAPTDPGRPPGAGPAPQTYSGEQTRSGSAASTGTFGELQPGTLVAKRFAVLALVGQGGMGAVLKVRDTRLDSVRAMKVIRPHLLDRKDVLSRFREEVITCQRLSHPNIVRVFDYDVDEAAGLHFFTMEFVEGQTLQRWLAQRVETGRPVSLAELHTLSKALCDALTYAHRTTVHRDLKPANVLVSEDLAAVRLADFGIAKILDPQHTLHTAAAVGTPHYMAPEQESGGRVDQRADIYSLGVLLYEVLSGHVPRVGSPPLTTVRPDVPPAVAAALLKAMADEPAQRFPGAVDLLAALSSAIGGGEIPGSVTIVKRAPKLRPIEPLQLGRLPTNRPETRKIELANEGDGPLDATLRSFVPWLRVAPSSLCVAPRRSETAELTIDLSGQPPGDVSGRIEISFEGGAASVLVYGHCDTPAPAKLKLKKVLGGKENDLFGRVGYERLPRGITMPIEISATNVGEEPFAGEAALAGDSHLQVSPARIRIEPGEKLALNIGIVLPESLAPESRGSETVVLQTYNGEPLESFEVYWSVRRETSIWERGAVALSSVNPFILIAGMLCLWALPNWWLHHACRAAFLAAPYCGALVFRRVWTGEWGSIKLANTCAKLLGLAVLALIGDCLVGGALRWLLELAMPPEGAAAIAGCLVAGAVGFALGRLVSGPLTDEIEPEPNLVAVMLACVFALAGLVGGGYSYMSPLGNLVLFLGTGLAVAGLVTHAARDEAPLIKWNSSFVLSCFGLPVFLGLAAAVGWCASWAPNIRTVSPPPPPAVEVQPASGPGESTVGEPGPTKTVPPRPARTEGQVLAVSGGKVSVDLGLVDGIGRGAILIVELSTKKIRDPSDPARFGYAELEIEVLEASADECVARPLESGETWPVRGDKVKIKSLRPVPGAKPPP